MRLQRMMNTPRVLPDRPSVFISFVFFQMILIKLFTENDRSRTTRSNSNALERSSDRVIEAFLLPVNDQFPNFSLWTIALTRTNGTRDVFGGNHLLKFQGSVYGLLEFFIIFLTVICILSRCICVADSRIVQRM